MPIRAPGVTAYRASLVGAGVGALVGAGTRAGITAYYFDTTREDATLVVLSALTGMIVGALAGATGTPVLGAAVGAVLSGLFFLLSFPVVVLLDVLGTATLPSLAVVLGMGAVAGGVGGAVARRWA
jgi:hypothetical protein